MKEKGKEQGRGAGSLSLEREQTDVTSGKVVVIKGKGKPHVTTGGFILIGLVNYGGQRGFLISGLQHFDSWTSVVSLRRRKWPDKGTDLGDSFRNATQQLEGPGQSHFCYV